MNVVFCNPASGLDRGFESYDFQTTDSSNRGHRNAAATTDAALDWVSQVADRPFFLLVHYFDAHLTYDPPAPFDTLYLEENVPAIPRGFGSARQVMALRNGSIPMTPPLRESLVARYDGELKFLDQEFGRLRTGLESLGRWDNSLVVIVGDHGEEFWDHGGFEHGHSHYRELLRVPLIVRKPDQEPGERRAERVRQLDIVPTVLARFGTNR
jgi:arylsulfatase A-like enzyme